MTERKFMNNIIHKPTRGPNILDLCFVSNEDLLGECKVLNGDNLSDHSLVFIDMNCDKNDKKVTKMRNHCFTDIVKYNIDDATPEQWTKFMDELDGNDLDLMKAMDLDSKIDYMYNALELAAKNSFI